LDYTALFRTGQIKTFGIQFSSESHEEKNPCHVHTITYRKNEQYLKVKICQDEHEHYKVHQREHDAETISHQKGLYPAMISDTLHYIARILRIEEVQRHTGKFLQEVRYE
jgi:hypothetical protein